MKDRNMKEIREDAEQYKTVDNAQALRQALPLVIEGQERVKSILSTVKKLAKAISELSEKCAAYALKHVNCFDSAIAVSPVGVESGDITVDGVTYHLAAGYETPKREDGLNLTQDFLEELPKEWTKLRYHLDTEGINRLGVSVAGLAEHGLYRPAKNVWSVVPDDPNYY